MSVLPNRVTRSDHVGAFWQLVNGLDARDLVSELVQNDFDEGATITRIVFEPDRIVVEGNGRQVNRAGWQRLSYIQGAGFEVASKRGGIGIKNHGLDTGFQLGDTIRVLSGGLWTERALFNDDSQPKPVPNAFEGPADAPPPAGSAIPEKGTRVEIFLRNKALEITGGEPIRLKAWSDEALRELFLDACHSAPRLFVGLVHPKRLQEYRLELRHHQVGFARFNFSVRRHKGAAKRRFQRFARQCQIETDIDEVDRRAIGEEAASRAQTVSLLRPNDVPRFFREGRKVRLEVAWRCTTKGKPRSIDGWLGYPIGYPPRSDEASSRLGCIFRAPFRSDLQRHHPAIDDDRNDEIKAACVDLLADVLADELLTRWGPNGFAPLLKLNPASEIPEDPAKVVLKRVVERGALPVVPHEDIMRLLRRRGPDKGLGTKAGRRPRAARYGCVVPNASEARDDSKDNARNALMMLCPENEPQIDPRTDHRVISALMSQRDHIGGFCEDWITFDQKDAFNLACGATSEWFEITDHERQAIYSDRKNAAALLDLILALEEADIDREDTLLPNAAGGASPLSDLRVGTAVPLDVPGIKLPPIIHPSIARHRIFKRSEWKRKKFDFSEFLDSGALDHASFSTRKAFWDWLVKRERKKDQQLQTKYLDALAAKPIWPATGDRLYPLRDLCRLPPRISKILGVHVAVASQAVVRSGLTVKRRGAPRYLRDRPLQDEVHSWYEQALQTKGKDWHSVEADLETLIRNRRIAPVVYLALGHLPAVNAIGLCSLRNSLVRQSQRVKRMQIVPRFLLAERSDRRSLDKIARPLDDPTAEMLVETFADDVSNAKALAERLLALQSADANQSHDALAKVAKLPIIEVGGARYAPSDLAFRSNRGDYWGNWKRFLPTTGIAPDLRSAFVHAGVTAALPNEQSSIEFFQWLNEQDDQTVTAHVLQVLRHLQASEGPRRWASRYPGLGTIAAHFGETIKLASLNDIQRGRVFIPDHPELGEAAKAKGRLGLAVSEAREIREPLRHQLREIGVPSLRLRAGPPVSVDPVDERDLDVRAALVDTLRTVQTERFASELPKRVGRLGADLPRLLRGDWKRRLGEVKAIRMARGVKATYSVGRQRIKVDRDGGFDTRSGILWLSDGLRDPLGAMLELIAADRVLLPEAEPLHHQVLRLALATGPLKLDSYKVDDVSEVGADGIDEEDAAAQSTESQAEGTAATAGGHRPVKPDPSRNLPSAVPPPSPKPIASTKGKDSKPSSESSGKAEPRRSAPRPFDANEQADRNWIKQVYATHCQRCLAETNAEILAPENSYAATAEHREKLIEMHHADLYAEGGARHRGNMVALCFLHHQELGNRLSRDLIVRALKTGGTPAKPFQTSETLEAAVYTVEVPGTDAPVTLLFSKTHRKEWLKLAQEAED